MYELGRIAAEMWRRLQTQRMIEARLPSGMRLKLGKVGGPRTLMVLALWRDDMAPSGEDVEAIAEAFHVPESVDLRRRIVREFRPETQRLATVHVAELSWIEEVGDDGKRGRGAGARSHRG